MESTEELNNSLTLEEPKWNCREVAQHLFDIQKAMSTSLLALVKTLEEDIGYGITTERIPAIREKYATLSRRVQELSTLSEPPVVRNLSRASSNAALTWASDYFTNLKNVIDNDYNNMNILLNKEFQNNDAGINLNNIISSVSEPNDKKEEDSKGFKNWLKKKFRSISDEPALGAVGTKNVFVEKFRQITPSLSSTTSTKSHFSKLCVFDQNNMPLTDLLGNVLKNAFGQPLLLFDNKGRPVDRHGSFVHDSRGIASNNQLFCPKENHRTTKLSPIALFDSKGYPLTGTDGHILLDPSGEPLVKFCQPGSDGLVQSDKKGGGVWDLKGIPLCPILGKWLDQDGRPYRFFQKNGMPVTDSKGRELLKIDGANLVMRDGYGRPQEVQDTFGVSITAYAFDGTLHPPNEVETFCNFKGNPMRLFNGKGHPLTDESGRVLFDSFGNPLVRVDFHSNPLKNDDGSGIFDEKKVPLFCNPTQPIIGMEGKPLLLYDKYRRPLTDSRGIPLVYACGTLLLKFDEIGRPYADQKGKPMYDINGYELADPLFDATITPSICPAQLQITYTGKPGLVVYDKAGRPLTDNDGNALVNSDGTCLEFNVIKQKRKMLKQEYDNYCRPIYNKFNINLYCHGKPIFDMFGQKIIDIDLAAPMSNYARNGNFNRFGIPVKDKYLRDLYDENGMPLCDKTGRPESKNVRNCDGVVLSVLDENKLIKLPIEQGKMLQGLTIEQDGLLVGIPKEYCLIPEEWVLSKEINENCMPAKEEGYDYFSAMIRTSNLSVLNQHHEILAIQPQNN